VVDRDLILRKPADLDLYLRQVAEFRGVDLEDYRGDWKTQRIVERTLQMAIELCVDVANHVIADHGLRVPATYSEAFDGAEAGMLPGPERDAMVRMVGFRNVIVHEYARVDADIVIRIPRQYLGDLTRFGITARAWI
jgi:uncharacterized protein YutE (UPF0331/DUF86 family)